MSEVLIGILIHYLLLSLFLAIWRISRYAGFEEYMQDVPMGDSEFFEPPVIFDWLTTLFLPATLFIVLWRGIVRLVNAVRY